LLGKLDTLSQAEYRHGNLLAYASRWFAFGKIQFMLCSAFTGSRLKAVAGRIFPRVSPDTRPRSAIGVWTHINKGRKLVLFWMFSSFVLDRKSKWHAWHSEAKIRSGSVSFRLFGVAQGSKSVVCSKRHEIEYNILCRIGCSGFDGTRLSVESGKNAWRHYVPSGRCMTAQQQTTWGNSYCNKTRRNSDPAYSPNLSSNDFFLFEMLKERMSGTSYSLPDELISAISELNASIPKGQCVNV
jgi:hypothetical protein